MEDGKIVISPKRSTYILYIISLAFAFACMVWLIFNVETDSGKTAAVKVLFAVCAVICVYAAVVLTKRIILATPLIIADESGFTDNSSDMGFVPWNDVKRLYMVTMKHNKLIQVELEIPEKYLYRLSGLARKTAEMNMKMGYQPISFSLNGTDRKDPDRLLAELIVLWERNR